MSILSKKSKTRSRPAQRQGRRSAFTVPELIVIISVLVILFGIIGLKFATARGVSEKSRRIKCLNDLKLVGLAFRIFATDHNDRFPWQIKTTAARALPPQDEILSHFLAVTNELTTPGILHCFSDTRRAAIPEAWTNTTRQNISYFISLDAAETLPNTFMAGDRNLATNNIPLGPGRVVFPKRVIPAWTKTQHKFEGNAVMGDGATMRLDQTQFERLWNQTGLATNSTFLFP